MPSMRPGFSNISDYFSVRARRRSEIESLASRSSSVALQLRFAQNDNGIRMDTLGFESDSAA